MTGKSEGGLQYEDAGFFVVVFLVTVAFAWLIGPYFGAVLWGMVAAIVFAPVNRMLVGRLGGRANLAASLTLLLILAVAVVPAMLIGVKLVSQAAWLYSAIEANHINPATLIGKVGSVLPAGITESLSSVGISETQLQTGIRNALIEGARQVGSRALVFGQGALGLLASTGLMLYLTWFLIRDGDDLSQTVRRAIPLRPALRDSLIGHFLTVVRATMKGTVVVALLQGLAGGTIFWLLGIDGALLWGLLMAFFSMIPAVGTGIVWVPVAAYLLITGSYLEGGILVFCGLFVIGMIDNVVRPFLVGKDTRMPDFVVLISTLAGLELFGLSGLIVGPVIAALFIAVWKIVSEQRELAAG